MIWNTGHILESERLGRLLSVMLLRASGYFSFHAGAVAIGGGAVIVCGNSGAGKSTLSAAWAILGKHEIMAEDLCLLFHRDAVVLCAGILEKIALSVESRAVLRRLGARLPKMRTISDAAQLSVVEREALKKRGLRYIAPTEGFDPARHRESHVPAELGMAQYCGALPICGIVYLDSGLRDPNKIALASRDEAFDILMRGGLAAFEPSAQLEYFDMAGELARSVPVIKAPEHPDIQWLLEVVETEWAKPHL